MQMISSTSSSYFMLHNHQINKCQAISFYVHKMIVRSIFLMQLIESHTIQHDLYSRNMHFTAFH